MRRIVLGFVVGVILAGVVGSYFVGPQYLELMSRVDEFDLETLHYLARGFVYDRCFSEDFLLPPNVPYEMVSNNYEFYQDFLLHNVSIIRVSREQLREEVEQFLESRYTGNATAMPRYGGVFVCAKYETISIWKYPAFRRYEVLWWSTKSNLPWSE